MNNVVKSIGVLVVSFVIVGLPVLSCLSFVLDWHVFIRFMLLCAVLLDALLVACGVYERSLDE